MGKYASVYFSPDRGTANVVVGFIDRCETTLDIAVYAQTHVHILDAIIRAHKRGVRVRSLIDKTQAGSRYSGDERLEEAGVSVRRDTQSGAMHHKFVVGDEFAVGTGSFNWTKNADERNTENFVVIRLLYLVRTYATEFERLWELNVPTD